MPSFVEGEIEKLAEQVGQKVLADLTPALSGFADDVANKVLAKIESLVESKLGVTPPPSA
jgi:hypothetical protein